MNLLSIKLCGFINLLLLVDFSSGELNWKTVKNQILEENGSGDCYLQYHNLDTSSLEKMFDSSSELIPKGMLDGNFVSLGFFDECLSISDEINKIYGKYCLSSIAVDQIISNENVIAVNKSFMELQQNEMKFQKNMGINPIFLNLLKLGICIPDQCHTKDLQKFLRIKLDETMCYTKFTNEKKNASAIIAISIIIGFLFITACSTTYEIYSAKRNAKTKHPILTAFSVYSNGKKLFTSTRNADQLTCVHGVRALSMLGVILHHTCLELMKSNDNMFYLNDWIDNPWNMFALSSNQAVDSFFTIGGLLVVYVYMKSKRIEWKESFKKIPSLYLNRYIRLTPAYAIMVLIYGSGLIRYLGDGPKWGSLDSKIDNCVKHWWQAITYTQNYMDSSKFCVNPSWYLSADFQLFIFSSFLIIPLKLNGRLVIRFMYALVLLGVAIPFYVGYSKKLSGIGVGSIVPEFGDYYFPTYNRFGSYVIGMISGYYIYKMKKGEISVKFNFYTLISVWIALIGGLLVCIFDGFKLTRNNNNEWLDGLYLGLNRNVWSSLVALIILMCCSGNGGPINSFLSLSVFQIISKLSYSIYLVHHLVIITTNAASRTTINFSNYVVFCQYISNCVIASILSVFLCLIFELPMITIQKLLV